MKSFFLSISVFLLIHTSALSQVYQADYRDDCLSIKVKNDSNVVIAEFFGEGIHPQFDSLINSFGIYRIERVIKDTSNAVMRKCYQLWFTDSARMDTLIGRLQNYSYLEYVSKIGIGQYYEDVPNDSNYRFQWGLQKVLVDSVWKLLPGNGKKIKIGIIDDAFLLGHIDLSNAIDTNYNDPINSIPTDDDLNLFVDDFLGWDMADQDNDVLPPTTVGLKEYSHGTHCALIAGGVSNNLHGVASFNRGKIKIIPIKNAPDAGWYPDGTKTLAAMGYAKAMGAKIISMSFQSINANDSVFMSQNPQIIFIVAAGNDGNSTNINQLGSYNLPNLICVGATNMFDEKSAFSNFHSSVDIMAPGSGIYSGLGTDPNAYDYKSGTSQATPLVASICAAIWSHDSTLTAQQVINRVLNTADSIDFENPGYSGLIGRGRINAYRAFNNITTQPHQAGFKTLKGRSLCSGDTLQFYARTYSNVRYIWDFGNGNIDTSAGSDTAHIYTIAGNHDVSLRIIDLSGNTLAFNRFPEYVSVANCQPLTGERVRWFFGRGAGLDFRSGRAKPDTSAINTINALEASFSYSDSAGNLIFYGGDGPVFNASDSLIRDESQLWGNPTQGYLPLVFNNKVHLLTSSASGGGVYYLTYASNVLSSPFPVKVYNDILPISKNSDGAVKSDESIIGVANCSGGYWLLFNGYDQDNNYNSKLIVLKMEDSSGIPKFSLNDTARLPSELFAPNLLTKMKASPNGQYIAVANFVASGAGNAGSISIFGFNQQTGKLDSLFWYPIGGVNSGFCFSPDSKLLYTSDPNTGLIYQLNLLDLDPYKTKGTVISDKDFIDMQIGPDSKLYLSKPNDGTLSVIDFPNNRNTFDEPNSCGFRQSAIPLNPGAYPTHLPNFVDGLPPLQTPVDFTYRAANCLELEFIPTRTCDTTIIWNFGDSTGDTAIRPSHTYSKPGIYLVVMINEQDTIKHEVVVGLVGKITGDTGICDTSAVYVFSTIKDDYFSYHWTATGGNILTRTDSSAVHTKFHQTGTLKVLVTDRRSGCKDSVTVHPTYGLFTADNSFTFVQPCLTQLNGSTINLPQGPTSYQWQTSFDSTTWSNSDTSEDQAYFIESDSLYFRRRAVIGACTSYTIQKILAKPQVQVKPEQTFACDGDSVFTSYFYITLNNWDTTQIWVRTEKRDSGQFSFNIVDSALYNFPFMANLDVSVGDSVRFSVQLSCGVVMSRTLPINPPSTNNMISLDSLPCAAGSTFSLTGTSFMLNQVGISYQWEKSIDSVTWSSTSAADTLVNYSGTGGADTVWYRRVVSNGQCSHNGNVITIFPRFQIVGQPKKQVVICSGGGTYTVNLDLNIVRPPSTPFVVRTYQKNGTGSYSITGTVSSMPQPIVSVGVQNGDSLFFAVVTSCGVVLHSDTVEVSACTIPTTFATNPSNRTVNEENDTFLFASVSDACFSPDGIPTPPSIKWQESMDNGGSWSDISNSNNDTLFLDNVSHCNNGFRYRQIYNTACGTSITSTSATLTVNLTGFNDLWWRDNLWDGGVEPTIDSNGIWTSPDIWVRRNADGDTNHQNPNYDTASSNYIYYRIKNRGTDTSKGGELYIYWTKLAMGERWPIDWTTNSSNVYVNPCVGTIYHNNTYPMGGEVNTAPITIPPIPPGGTHIEKVAWNPPNPYWYGTRQRVFGNIYVNVIPDSVDVCLLGRILTCERDSFGLTRKEVQRIKPNIYHNNNIVTRNLRLTNINRIQRKSTTWVGIRNTDDVTPCTDIRMPAHATFPAAGEVFMHLNDVLLNSWQSSGFVGSGFTMIDSNTLHVTPYQTFVMSNVCLTGDEYAQIGVEFVMDSTYVLTTPETYQFSIGQYTPGTTNIVGGVNFDVTLTMDGQDSEEHVDSLDFIIVPNPTEYTETVAIEIDMNFSTTSAVLNIYNQWGGSVISEMELGELNEGENTRTVYIAELSAGSYSVVITANGQNYTQTMIILE